MSETPQYEWFAHRNPRELPQDGTTSDPAQWHDWEVAVAIARATFQCEDAERLLRAESDERDRRE